MQQQAEKILGEMEELLDALIENAKRLLERSKQVIDEEELIPLQNKQQELVTLLVEKDEAFHQACSGSTKKHQSPLRGRIDDKLEQFKQLNAQFIDNIVASHGLIQFEKGKMKKKSKSP